MSRAQQPSIRSFFQPRRPPEYAAPPSSSAPPPTPSSNAAAAAATPPTPPSAPPLPPTLPPTTTTTGARTKPVTIPLTLPPQGVPVLPSPPSLPSGASIVPLAEQHIAALRRINSLLLPVAYPDSFYAKALDPLASGLFSRAILWQDSDAEAPKVVGGLVCRLEPNPFLDRQGQPLRGPRPPPSKPQTPVAVPPDTPYHAIYIQSLALLSPYRSLGLATAALEHIIASAALLPAAGSSIDARTIYAHVWTENDEGLKWYEARGFRRDGEPVKGYYFKLRPDTAWVVARQIGAAGDPQTSISGPAPALVSPLSPPADPATQVPLPRPGQQGAVLAAAVNLPPIPAPSPGSTAPPPPAALVPCSSKGGGSSKPSPSPAPSSKSSSSLSFQNTRPETEWNDLPADMVSNNNSSSSSSNNNSHNSRQRLSPHQNHNTNGGGPASGASSRSSSAARKRKERAYPSAAFGMP